ncbi:unnamed protein product [Symbiodinium necroappetens]|uniref:Uncharacterized protein n=1 Tax=Symbiodinium necroappetens TaxID=1628268 RepID=A0A813BRW2_9DINO|nr:unnamed protein product [Symbiodinium necroappetens]
MKYPRRGGACPHWTSPMNLRLLMMACCTNVNVAWMMVLCVERLFPASSSLFSTCVGHVAEHTENSHSTFGLPSQTNVRGVVMYLQTFAPHGNMYAHLCNARDAPVVVVSLYWSQYYQLITCVLSVILQRLHWISYMIMWLLTLVALTWGLSDVPCSLLLTQTFQGPACFASVVMDGWDLTKRAGEGKPHASQKRQAIGTEALLAKAMLLVSKLTLKAELEVRELQAATFRTLTITEMSAFVTEARATMKAYTAASKQARDNGQPAPLGEPHVHVWSCFLKAALDVQGMSEEHVQRINEHRAQSADPHALAQLIFVCKIKKAYDRGIVKVHLAGHQQIDSVIDAVVAAMVLSGARERRGQAPQSGMARELQSLVDELQEITK